MKITTRLVVLAGLLIGAVLAFVHANPTSAASAWDYNAGNIISDAVMRNYNSMDVGAIQNFLKSKNDCNDTRTYIASWYPTVYYHIENGHFVCMADENFNGKSAAKIIYQTAQDFHINPQVLIVLLQKEQGLVTDTYPHDHQYRTATGYGCPDTSACETRYYGFENQVRNAAALFDAVLNGGWTNYPPGWRYVPYSPHSECGGNTINIENLATSALYRYTPYQPNDAAKNAGYGTGDWCSAYGNRNFFLYFADWFGSTQTPSFSPSSTNSDASISASSFYIPEGNYRLLTTGDKALDVNGAGTSDGTNIQIWSKNDTSAQIFHISRFSNGFYRITNVGSNKSVDVNGAGTSDGTNIQLWSNNDTCAQKWSVSMQDQYYVFRNACSGKALDVNGAHVSTVGENVQLWSYNQTPAQTWRLEALDYAPVRDGTYRFSTIHGNTSLDVNGAGTSDGTNIQVWSNNDTSAQKFTLSRNTDGYYRILNPNSNKSVDVNGASIDNGTNIQLWSNNDTCAQKWAISKLGEYYIFRNACSGKALDIYGGTIDNSGNNVNLWDYNASIAQQWVLKSH